MAALLLAAEAVGAATRCRKLTVEYAKERVQFGRPDRQFPGPQAPDGRHVRQGPDRRRRRRRALQDPSPTSARWRTSPRSRAFRDVAGEAIQLHGGIAITAEHDIQLYFKRAHGSAQLFGQPIEYLRRLESAALN